MKIGDYIRTQDGIIAKIVNKRKNPKGEETIFVLDKEINICNLELGDMYSILNPLAEETTNEIDTHFGDEKIILKSSPNIIDLIEVGDYVNGWPVVEHAYTGDLYTTYVYVGGKGFTTFEDYCNELKEDFIETIVTKEQFESMEYEIK